MTPEHIKPVWYFTPYYAMLRVDPAQALGVLVMFARDRDPVPGAVAGPQPGASRIRYRGWLAKVMLGAVRASASSGSARSAPVRAPTRSRRMIGRVLTFLYFAFFITMPLWTQASDKTKPVPERVTTHD